MKKTNPNYPIKVLNKTLKEKKKKKYHSFSKKEVKQ